MGRIADYLETLSASERDQFRELIEECSLREVTIQQNAARADAALAKLAEQQRLAPEKIRDLEQAGQRLMKTASRAYLHTVPTPSRMH